MENVKLIGQNIILRRPIESDIVDRFYCGRVEEIIRMYGGDTRNIKPYTKEDAIRWYEKAVSNHSVLHIEFEKKFIGTVRLTIDEKEKRARYAIGIQDSSKLGMGFGTETTKLILKYAFEELKLHKVDLRVLDFNKRAIECYKKCGFVIEGIDREGAYIEDKWESDLFMSILDHEYDKLYKQNY